MTEIAVALIGSSGGGTATLGHTDPQALMTVIDRELQKIAGRRSCRGICQALFVALDSGKGFDNIDEQEASATLFQISQTEESQRGPLHCDKTKSGILKDVNSCCKELNKDLAKAISNGTIHALICISISVDVFSETLEAAATTGIPVTGTGGTSLSSAASKFQIRLVGNAGGSVANTSLTRAVSYAQALASDFNADYRPWRIKSAEEDELEGPSWRSILNACLPVFWGVCILRRILETVLVTPQALASNDDSGLSETLFFLSYALEHHAIPTACAVVVATSCSSPSAKNDLDTSSLIMASVVASAISWKSMLCGMFAGYLVSIWQRKVLYLCIVQRVPATMTNLVATGGVGAVVALIISPVAPLLRSFTSFIRSAITYSLTFSGLPDGAMAFAWGCLCCYGSKVGWYHSIILPIILVEMECGSPSFLGAIDELTLVLVCAGVCLGNCAGDFLFPKKDVVSDADLALCWRAARINLLFGDFVEAAYPFMEQHKIINIGCYVASGLSSYILVAYPDQNSFGSTPKSLAYLPFPISIWLAGNEWKAMLVASTIAFGLPFLCVILNFTFVRATK